MLNKRSLLLWVCFLIVFYGGMQAENETRINLAASCHDCDYIPKVTNAGNIEIYNGVPVQIMHNGVRVLLGGYHGNWMSTIISILKGHHEPQEEKVFYEVLKTIPNKATMIELGSSWAYYSAWFNKAIVGAFNYMIEPHPEKLALGKKNFVLNDMVGTFYNAFIGSTTDRNAVFIDWDEKEFILPKICIDDFVMENKINFIHILHSDIQGAEYEMLLGAQKTMLDKKIGYIFISTHGNWHKQCYNFLKNFDFIIIAEHTPQESYSGDGLIVGRHSSYPGLNYIEISKNNVNG